LNTVPGEKGVLCVCVWGVYMCVCVWVDECRRSLKDVR